MNCYTLYSLIQCKGTFNTSHVVFTEGTGCSITVHRGDRHDFEGTLSLQFKQVWIRGTSQVLATRFLDEKSAVLMMGQVPGSSPCNKHRGLLPSCVPTIKIRSISEFKNSTLPVLHQMRSKMMQEWLWYQCVNYYMVRPSATRGQYNKQVLFVHHCLSSLHCLWARSEETRTCFIKAPVRTSRAHLCCWMQCFLKFCLACFQAFHSAFQANFVRTLNLKSYCGRDFVPCYLNHTRSSWWNI